MDRPTVDGALAQLCINTIRTLSMDAVQQANSGHPGTPMAMAPVAFLLYDRVLRQNPRNPAWPARDRFVLSAGHASMLLYSALHLTGYDVSLEDIKKFRQLGSKCPGHPEYGFTPGVETTTGPLGQGVATAVGMALAQKWLAAHFDRPGHEIADYRVFALCGDGCMMEGVSGEAASLAGHLGLNNLVWIYDNNHITIEGNTALAFTEDVAARFCAYHWNVMRVGDANDLGLLGHALDTALNESERPTLLIVDSHIAYGAPNKQDTSGAHGEPLGEEEIRLTKARYGWPPDAKFLVPPEVAAYRDDVVARGTELEAEWNGRFAQYAREFPELAREFERMQRGELPAGWDRDVPTFAPDPKGLAGRDASGKVLNAIAKRVPYLLGGSADLTPSTKTRLDGGGDVQKGAYEAEIYTSASASTAWAPCSTAWRSASSGSSGRASSSSRTTAGPRSGWRRSWSCRSASSSRTTASASARTAPPINRSSSSSRCARSRIWSRCGPRTRARSSRRGGSSCRAGRSRWRSC